MKKKILLQISYDLYGKILQFCEKKEMTKSQAIRHILLEHLTKEDNNKNNAKNEK